MNKYVKKVKPFFPNSHVYKEDELILEPKNNIYFRIDNVENDLEFDCKMIEWLSRPASKHHALYWKAWFLRGLNSYFRKTWTLDEMRTIYTRLGNGVNRILCIEFIQSGFDLNLLMDEVER